MDLGYGIVTNVDSMLNIRSGPDTEYELVGTLRNRTVISLLGVDNGWYKISYKDITGYVSSDYIATCKDSSGLRADGTSIITLGNQIIAYGEQFLGVPYVWGGNGPKCFDCSGFTKYVMNHFGYDINRTASAQSTNGVAVSRSELQPGDLVFFHTFSSYVYITHVGIYAGNGQFIHASSSKGITYSDLNSPYYSDAYVCARRII
ncbi:MAG: C40 family peptidase [Oscillospiraceae bacterium]|nr:C40 family peptidase [Oscillospiraceae bacterium]